MKDELEKLMDNIAANAQPEPEEYTDPESGLLFCVKCRTQKQCRVTLFEKERLMPCLCQCEQDRALFAYTFERDDGQNLVMKYARRYVDHQPQMREHGQELLLWGYVDTGNTFAAACIVHALTEQGVPVLMTNFSKILNSLSGMFREDRNKYLASFHHFSLLTIDISWVERNLEYALEQVYNIVGSRYLSRLPFIITTNLTLAELQAPADLPHAQIYDRVLERCTPVCFSGKNYRKDNATANKDEATKLLTD